jgi:hypothetical protein
LKGKRLNILSLRVTSFLLSILFLFEFLEGAGRLPPESEVGKFVMLGRGQRKVGGDKDVLILEILLTADDRYDNLVGQGHSI